MWNQEVRQWNASNTYTCLISSLSSPSLRHDKCAVARRSIPPSHEYHQGINRRMPLQPPPEYMFPAHVRVRVAPMPFGFRAVAAAMVPPLWLMTIMSESIASVVVLRSFDRPHQPWLAACAPCRRAAAWAAGTCAAEPRALATGTDFARKKRGVVATPRNGERQCGPTRGGGAAQGPGCSAVKWSGCFVAPAEQ